MTYHSLDPDILFHLVPKNLLAQKIIIDHSHQVWVSETEDGVLGLEARIYLPGTNASYDVAALPSDAIHSSTVILALDNSADVVLITTTSNKISIDDSIRSLATPRNPPTMSKCKLLLGRNGDICLGSLKFEVVWRKHRNVKELRGLVFERISKHGIQKRQDLFRLVPRSSLTKALEKSINLGVQALSDLVKAPEIGPQARRTEASPCSIPVSGQAVFLKTFRRITPAKPSKRAETIAENDLKKWKHISHANIAAIVESDTNSIHLFSHACDGSLEDFKHKAPESGARFQTIERDAMHQLLGALDFLAFNRLCHLNIKPTNILYKRQGVSGAFQFLLSDPSDLLYGSVSDKVPNNGLYKAPEITTGQRSKISQPNTKADVWSLAATMLMVGRASDPQIESPGQIMGVSLEIIV